jgi:hypothetical protein
MSMEQQQALPVAAANLRERFAGVFGLETIKQFLASSYASSRRSAGVDVPAVARREVRTPTPDSPREG